MANTIKRYQIADYLNIGTETDDFVLMGIGINTLDESPNAQTEGKIYINQKSQTNSIDSYQVEFSFDTDLIKEEKAVMALYDIGRNQRTGEDAEREYLRVELFEPIEGKENVFKARKFKVAVQVDSIEGEGGAAIHVTGSLMGVGDFIDGEFNTVTREFISNQQAEAEAVSAVSGKGIVGRAVLGKAAK